MSGFRVAALACVVVAVGIVLALYGADIAFVLGFVSPSNPYDSVFGGSSLPAPARKPRGVESVVATSGPVAKAPRKKLPPPGPKDRRLVIPRISANVPVAGGNSAQALARGAYHEPGTADPGQGDNVVLAGHRNRNAFSLLYRLRPGDPVILYWLGKEHDYRVSKVFDVAPTDTRILVQAGREQLTLYTCRPRELGDKRTVVVAVPVGP